MATDSAKDVMGLSTSFAKMKLKIAILGTRGIPNNYGGYEQIATYLAQGLVNKGHAITVYNSHNHPYQENEYKGINIQHCYDPELKLGTAGQFIYDWNCIRHASKQNFDVLLFMGYTSSSVWGRFFPSEPVIVSNMDGLEWKRAKYAKPVQAFLKKAEAWAVKFSDFHIADSTGIVTHLYNLYGIDSFYIPYAAQIQDYANEEILQQYNLTPGNYYLAVARMEPENNIELILNGFSRSKTDKQFVIVGNTHNKYGKYLKQKFSQKNVVFTEGVFDQQKLHALRSFCSLYFHGHSVGGTNPSLLEAMSSKAFIAAHSNEFNKAILGQEAYYFTSANDVKNIIDNHLKESKRDWQQKNFSKIETEYNWQKIIDTYELFLCNCYKQKLNEKHLFYRR
jgi:glycosyltransferase involved in cell wall biosynthesis